MPASVTLIWSGRAFYHRVEMTWADSGYSGALVDYAAGLGVSQEIVAKLAGRSAFTSCPAAGSWNARCPGSAAADGPSATTNA